MFHNVYISSTLHQNTSLGKFENSLKTINLLLFEVEKF